MADTDATVRTTADLLLALANIPTAAPRTTNRRLLRDMLVSLSRFPTLGSETGVTSELYAYGDVRRFGWAATATGLANAVAWQNAITSAPDGAVLTFPEGSYTVDSAGSQIVLVTAKKLTLRGSGWGSQILVKSTVGASTDVIRCVGLIEGLRIENLRILPESGTPARYGINFDVTTNPVSYVTLDNAWIGTFGSYAIQCTNPTPITDGLFTLIINNNSVIKGGVNLAKAGDSIRFRDSTFTGPRGIVVDLVDTASGGAKLFELFGCNVTCDAGVRVISARKTRIIGNNMEQPNATTEANSALIDLDGTSAKPLQDVVVEDNFLGANTGNVLSTVRVNYATGAKIYRNLTVPPGVLPTYAAYRITANAVATRIADEYLSAFGTQMSSSIDDLGAGTRVEWTSPSTNNRRYSGIKESKINRVIHEAGSAQSTNALDEWNASNGTTPIFKITEAGITSGAAGTEIKQIRLYSSSLTPTSVGAATMAEQTFTVTGLTTLDRVFISNPAPANACNVVSGRVSATDTLALLFCNPTAGALTPVAGSYRVLAIGL